MSELGVTTCVYIKVITTLLESWPSCFQQFPPVNIRDLRIIVSPLAYAYSLVLGG